MEKYTNLSTYFANHSKETFTISFSEIETIINDSLTERIKSKESAWPNTNSNNFSASWNSNGFKRGVIDFTNKTVEFYPSDDANYASNNKSNKKDKKINQKLLKRNHSVHYKEFYNTVLESIDDKARRHNIPLDKLELYYKPQIHNNGFDKINNLQKIYYRLLFHAQNGTKISNVINFEVNFRIIESITLGFNYEDVLNTYQNSQEIQQKLTNLNIKQTSQWTLYCKTIYSAAKFIDSNFKSYDDFINKIISLKMDAPRFIKKNVFGYGYTLSCDFLKEIDSRIIFAKPDLHIKDIINTVYDMDETLSMDKFLEKVVLNMFDLVDGINAECKFNDQNKLTVYKLDKLLYLIGTEYFYLDDKILNRSNSKRLDFLKLLKARDII